MEDRELIDSFIDAADEISRLYRELHFEHLHHLIDPSIRTLILQAEGMRWGAFDPEGSLYYFGQDFHMAARSVSSDGEGYALAVRRDRRWQPFPVYLIAGLDGA